MTDRPNFNIRFNLQGIPAGDGTTGTTHTLFDLEKVVVNNLNKFYQLFAIYLRCSGDLPIEDSTVNYTYPYENKRGCSTDDKNIARNKARLTSSYAELQTSIDAFNAALEYLNTTTGGITQTEYEQNYNALVNKHKEILTLRSDIDEKMKNIEAVDNVDKRVGNPRVQDVFIYRDTTIYSSMMITVLATSLLYYAFVKM